MAAVAVAGVVGVFIVARNGAAADAESKAFLGDKNSLGLKAQITHAEPPASLSPFRLALPTRCQQSWRAAASAPAAALLLLLPIPSNAICE